MANINSFGGVYNVPKMVVADTNEHALTVPVLAGAPSGVTWAVPYYASAFTSNANPYAGFPSPVFPVNSGLCIGFPPDVAGSLAVDGHPFKIKLAGVANNPGGGACTLKLYQVPLASLGVISATGSVTSAGAPGSGDTSIASLSLGTASAHFLVEAVMIWDSGLARLDGYTVGTSNATLLDLTATSAVSSGVAAVSALNFMPSVTFATGNAANALTVQEFSLERD